MREKKFWLSMAEQIIVLSFTAAAFQWAKCAALAERGFHALGGEYLFWLIPLIYFLVKQSFSDLLADLRNAGPV